MLLMRDEEKNQEIVSSKEIHELKDTSTSNKLQGKKMRDPRELFYNHKTQRYPYCLVWTPIPCITWLLPCIGHVGICTSEGVIHDFAGPYYISIDDFAFGVPHKYVKLDVNPVHSESYDQSIFEADAKYRKQMHNLCCNNCHSHVAAALKNFNYKNSKTHNMITIWWMLCTKSHYISCGYLMKTYLTFLILLSIIAIIIIVTKI